MAQFRYLNGYVLRYCPNHPRNFGGINQGHCQYVYEHILVAERSLGRALKKHEVVHHLNYIRSDNAPENLLVLTRSQHRSLHAWLDQGGPILGNIGLRASTRISITEHERLKHGEYSILKIRRCKCCQWPLANHLNVTCSVECAYKLRTRNSGLVRFNITKSKLLRLRGRGLAWDRIGDRYGVSGNNVRKWAYKLGLDPHDC